MPKELSDADDFGVSRTLIEETAAALSDEAVEHLTKRAKALTVNDLLMHDVPKSPRDVFSLVQAVVLATAVNLVTDGYATFTEKALASDEERERNVKAYAQAKDIKEKYLSALTGGDARSTTTSGVGAYL